MRIPVPSFRIQIVLLVTVLFVAASLFFRSYFLGSFQNYQNQIQFLELTDKINELYYQHRSSLSPDERDKYKDQIENLLIDIKQIHLAGDLFEREISLYSIFIFFFLIATVLLIFLVTFGMITRPLMRLQDATKELGKGNLDVQVKENRFSPMNDLIVSFNTMASELLENRNRLIEAEKEMMWREMAQVMAHEIKNPLTPIRLQIQRLEHKYLMDSDDFEQVFDGVIKIVNEEVDNLQSLVNQFRDFAKMPSASFGYYDLKQQIEEIAFQYDHQADIHFNTAENLPEFYGDKMQMKQVFVNLIQNAIHSMNSDRTLNIKLTFEDPNFVITVEDHGSGIAREDQDKIFQPYFTRKKKGTGLGLAIVKRIVQTHNGTIRLQSEEGHGSAFTLVIPGESHENAENE